MIDLVGLTKTYGRTRAVDDLTCTIRPGVVTGFLGPNGAGKSTTMRMIVGLDRPTAGTATVAGKRYRELAHPLRSVGALLDARQVHPGRTAAAHLRWIAASNKISRNRVDVVLEQVGLTDVGTRRAGTFSLGMMQRLGIAAALLGDPPVLLFDEPVNGLDPEGIRWIRTLMRSLAGEGRTVLVSSHLLAEMAHTADELVVIGQGRLITATSMDAVLRRTVRVRSPQIDQLAALLPAAHRDGDALLVDGAGTEHIGELAARHGIVLHELSIRQSSLEDAYLGLTDAAVQYRAGGDP